MELIRNTNDSPALPRHRRHSIQWMILVITAILLIENWRIVLVVSAALALLLVAALVLAVVVLIRRANRPLAQLTLADVALVAWAHRRWESRRVRRQLARRGHPAHGTIFHER